jgi:hypothetical protein
MTKSPHFLSSLSRIGLGLVLAVALFGVALTAPVHAAASNSSSGDADPQSNICQPGQAYDPQKPCLPNPNDLQSTPDSADKTCSGGDCSGIIAKYVNPAIRLLSGLVGVLVAISMVVAGIQYASAGGDPSKVVAARKRITNAILALLAYLFMFAFLQWLIPGGII